LDLQGKDQVVQEEKGQVDQWVPQVKVQVAQLAHLEKALDNLHKAAA